MKKMIVKPKHSHIIIKLMITQKVSIIIVTGCNYLFLKNANTTSTANMIITIMCMGSSNIGRNYYICIMPAIIITMPIIIHAIACISFLDLIIPAMPMPAMSSPIKRGNFISKITLKNKLLSRNVCSAVS